PAPPASPSGWPVVPAPLSATLAPVPAPPPAPASRLARSAQLAPSTKKATIAESSPQVAERIVCRAGRRSRQDRQAHLTTAPLIQSPGASCRLAYFPARRRSGAGV